MLFALAWRNVWRHRGRTFLTASAVAFSSALLIFAGSLQLSSYQSAIRATTALFDGQLQVQREGFRDSPALWKTIESPDTIEQLLKQNTNIERFTPRAMGFALLSSLDRSRGVQLVGVLPEQEQQMISLPGLVRSGRWLEQKQASEIVIGAVLGKNLGVRVGDELTLLGQGDQGSLAVGVLKVVGFYQSGSGELDRGLAFLPLETFQEIFGIQDKVHSYVVELTDLDHSSQVDQALDQALRDSSSVSLDWRELNPGLEQGIALDLISGQIFYASLAFIVSLGVFNTFLMSTLERSREFGVLMAVGLSKGKLLLSILLEALCFVLAGLVPGLLLGIGVTTYFGIVGFSIPGTEQMMQIWNLPSAIYPTPRALVLIGVSSLFCLLPVLFAFPILYRILKLDLTSSLR